MWFQTKFKSDKVKQKKKKKVKSEILNLVHFILAQYPLRPELAESLYVLYYYETDPSMQREWLYYGSHMLDSLEKFKTSCGVASVSNVETKQLRDEMPSFFLSETLKYLYLLFNTAEQRKRLELGLSKKVDVRIEKS